MIPFLSAIIGFIGTMLTGGKYGSSVPSEYGYNYAKSQERKRKDFAQFGGRDCKICGARIAGNRSYCGPCWFTYKKP